MTIGTIIILVWLAMALAIAWVWYRAKREWSKK